jgi:hypothetical protein
MGYNPPSGNPQQPVATLFGGSTGDLFNRIGAWGGVVNAINIDRGTLVPAQTATATDQYETIDQDLIQSIYTYLSSYQNGASTYLTQIQSICSATLLRMVSDVLSIGNNPTTTTAMQALIAQMQANNQSVKACTISSSVGYRAANIGNPVAVVSVRNTQGLFLEDLFAETATATVSNSSQYSSSVAGVEPLSVQGQYSVSNTFSWMYPAGSGANLTVSAISGMSQGQGGSGNWLMNGSFESTSATANIPLNWTILTGVPGTTVFQATSDVYDGTYSLQFAGDSSTLTTVVEGFSTATTTGVIPTTLYPNVQLSFNCFIRTSSTPASGVLQVALTNGSSPTVDNDGNTNSTSVNLNTIGTTWVPFNAVFRTPSILPSTPTLAIGLTTALPAGYSVFIDRCSVSQMVQLYAGGPYLSIFSGNINMQKGDQVYVTLANNYGGRFQQLFDIIFGMKSMGLLLPSNATGGQTISDSLIPAG